MKKINQTLAIILVLFVGLQSCKPSKKDGEKIKDEQLTGFMLGGIYFIHGYGGVEKAAEIMSEKGNSNKDLVAGHKEYFEFAFGTSAEEAEGSKTTLAEWWEIKNKADLLEVINDLKKEGENKAWDYARIINNISMGYSCGYLTKDEVLKINSEVLVLARKQYKDWNLYYADWQKGRDAWNPKDPNKASFDAIVKDIEKNEKSIYNILPLN